MIINMLVTKKSILKYLIRYTYIYIYIYTVYIDKQYKITIRQKYNNKNTSLIK